MRLKSLSNKNVLNGKSAREAPAQPGQPVPPMPPLAHKETAREKPSRAGAQALPLGKEEERVQVSPLFQCRGSKRLPEAEAPVAPWPSTTRPCSCCPKCGVGSSPPASVSSRGSQPLLLPNTGPRALLAGRAEHTPSGSHLPTSCPALRPSSWPRPHPPQSRPRDISLQAPGVGRPAAAERGGGAEGGGMAAMRGG